MTLKLEKTKHNLPADDMLSDTYTVQRTHTKTKTKPSYVPATFRNRKQMSAEGSDA